MPINLESIGGEAGRKSKEKRPEDSSASDSDEYSIESLNNEQGSLDLPYKLLVVGGGPAGYSILVRALRLSMWSELCDSTKTYAGVCLLESGTAERLGGGKLQDYLINSNTHGHKFYTHVMEPQPTNLPPESVAGTSLARLGGHKSTAGAELRDAMQGKEAPLALAGAWMRDVAQHVGEAVRQFPASSCCLTDMRVAKLQRCKRPKSEMACKASPAAASSSGAPPGDGGAAGDWLWRVTAQDSGGTTREFYAQTVTLATGGRQELPVLSSAVHTAKLIASDRVCTAEGIEEVRSRMQRAPKKQQRIVIVGGSHSAFSAAWMCLNKIDLHSSNQLDAPPGSPVASASGFGASSICILHRSPIRVFYASRREAEADGNDYIGTVHRSSGQIHPFGGLRADAKELWQRVRRGKETRVRLLKATVQQSLAQKLFDEAAVIIWACGYSTNVVDVLDEAGVNIPLRMFRGQVEVDDQARLLRDGPAGIPALPQPVGSLFGIGLGYGLKATVDGDRGELDGSSGRADGVAVYLKRGATLVLASVLGTKVFGSVGDWKLQSWEERIAALKKGGVGGDDDRDGGVSGSGPPSPLSPLRSPTAPVMLAATSPIMRRVASATGGVAARSGPAKSLSLPPVSARSSTASALGSGSRRERASAGHRALVGELLGILKTETLFLEPDRMADSIDRLSRPRPRLCMNPVEPKTVFSSPVAPPKGANGVTLTHIFSPLKTRKNLPSSPFVAIKPAPLNLPGLA